MSLAFPARFGGKQKDEVAECQREHLLLECQALLSDDPTPYAAPLAELERHLVLLLAPKESLHPQDPANILLALEARFADGVAELERAGYSAEGLSVYAFWHKLGRLQKKAK